jgi:hypothetical protein
MVSPYLERKLRTLEEAQRDIETAKRDRERCLPNSHGAILPPASEPSTRDADEQKPGKPAVSPLSPK